MSRSILLAIFASASLLGVTLANDRPNILFAISDDQSYPHCSVYGCKGVSTPAFDQVAKSGVLMRNAFCASPGCSPSRAAILTGRYPWQLQHAGTHASKFSSEYPVFPSLLEEAGYHVGYTGKGWGPGNWKDGGFTRNPAGPSYQTETAKPPATGMRANDYAANFGKFLEAKPDDAPFCFWFGASEPHRVFEKGSGLRMGKKLVNADVPSFLPDTDEIRSDMLDYYVEIEHFDNHLGRMLKLLEKRGQLANTLVIVTSDNGMAFPRAKANCYEFGIHLPLAIAWPKKIPAGSNLDDLSSFIDFAPTILSAAGLEIPELMQGKSMLKRLSAPTDTKPIRQAVFSGRERHSSSRWNNLAYPQRVIRTNRFLYIRNFKPERWPAGAPQKLEGGELGPMYGGYHDIDACPSLTFLIEQRNDTKLKPYFHWAVDHRPAEELFDIVKDPACVKNLASEAEHQATRTELSQQLEQLLTKTKDPRVLGNGDIWETYKRYSRIRQFPQPDWAK